MVGGRTIDRSQQVQGLDELKGEGKVFPVLREEHRPKFGNLVRGHSCLGVLPVGALFGEVILAEESMQIGVNPLDDVVEILWIVHEIEVIYFHDQ